MGDTIAAIASGHQVAAIGIVRMSGEQNIAYAMPPASFEQAQRIRMPDAVLESKQGTCCNC